MFTKMYFTKWINHRLENIEDPPPWKSEGGVLVVTYMYHHHEKGNDTFYECFYLVNKDRIYKHLRPLPQELKFWGWGPSG